MARINDQIAKSADSVLKFLMVKNVKTMSYRDFAYLTVVRKVGYISGVLRMSTHSSAGIELNDSTGLIGRMRRGSL